VCVCVMISVCVCVCVCDHAYHNRCICGLCVCGYAYHDKCVCGVCWCVCCMPGYASMGLEVIVQLCMQLLANATQRCLWCVIAFFVARRVGQNRIYDRILPNICVYGSGQP